MPYTINVQIFYDTLAKVWVAIARGEGIVTEAATKEKLLERLSLITPDVMNERLGYEPKSLILIIETTEEPQNLEKIAA